MRAVLLKVATAGFVIAAFSLSSLSTAPAMGSAIAKPLPCHTSMSSSHPADYTTTTVRVKTAAQARVTTVAYYRTVTREHHGRANDHGRANIPYYISGATPGYQVIVDVYVKWPHRHGSCQTSFTPHA
jgi:hypothetical protein